MIRIPLTDLRSISADRPEGYYDEVLAAGRIEMIESVVLDEAAYRELQKKFGSQIQPIPRKDWPIWAKALVMLSKPEDKGIGDVVARTIGAENSQAFKKWFKATTGKDCGCTGRQGRWNIEYPLRNQTSRAT